MTNPRTSISHPLKIAEVKTGESCGIIGITFAPGKIQSDGMSGAWERDLGTDLDVIAEWNAAAVVTLVEGHELESMQIAGLEWPSAHRCHQSLYSGQSQARPCRPEGDRRQRDRRRICERRAHRQGVQLDRHGPLQRGPIKGNGRRVIFVSGDHDEPKAFVKDLITKFGFVAIDLGGLVTGGRMQQAGGPLAGLDLFVAA
jgi:hypothetical protein